VTFRLEGAAVGLAVDAARETTHDDDTGSRKLAADHPRDLPAVRRARSRTDDRHGGPPQELGLGSAAQMQPLRRIVDRLQERRQLVPPEDHAASSGGAR
jgi:hypothetical protein